MRVLMELEDDVFTTLHEGGSLQFVGCRDGEVALCTATTTHKVTAMESSSRSLVVDDQRVVSSSVVSYVTKKIKPDVDARKLPHYPAPPIETLDAQASEHELRRCLDESPNVLKSGGFAWVDDALVHKALADLFNSLALQGWPSDHIPREDCLADVSAHGGDRVSQPRFAFKQLQVLVGHCLQHFSDGARGLDNKAIALFQCKLLFNQSREWRLDAFLTQWHALLPVRTNDLQAYCSA